MLSDDVRHALTMAENRADRQRAYDQRDGITRAFLDPFADVELDDDED